MQEYLYKNLENIKKLEKIIRNMRPLSIVTREPPTPIPRAGGVLPPTLGTGKLSCRL